MEKINLYISKKNQKYFKNENVNKNVIKYYSELSKWIYTYGKKGSVAKSKIYTKMS